MTGILHPASYSIQQVPGNGDCFFYSIALILLNIVDHCRVENPSPVVVETVHIIRCVTASKIYETPQLIELLKVTDDDVCKMPMDSGKPDAHVYFHHFLTNHPFADQYEVKVVQELPLFSNTVFVIYNTAQCGISFVCSMHFPAEIDDIIMLRRNGEHYEPIVLYVKGNWQHRLPIAQRYTPQYQILFDRISAQCRDFREKVG
jgi:hypothetical protein